MLTPEGYREKEDVREVLADVVITCLWNPEVTETCGETDKHYIRAWKEEGMVKAEIRRK